MLRKPQFSEPKWIRSVSITATSWLGKKQQGYKERLHIGRETDTKAIYEFVNLEACITLTTALAAELSFWFIKQLFHSTLCLDSSLHRCIKVTNVRNKEKHYESYLIQFWFKDPLYVCRDTHVQDRLKKIPRLRWGSRKSVCQQPGMIIFNQMQPPWHSPLQCCCQALLPMYFSAGLLQFTEDWVWKALPRF